MFWCSVYLGVLQHLLLVSSELLLVLGLKLFTVMPPGSPLLQSGCKVLQKTSLFTFAVGAQELATHSDFTVPEDTVNHNVS